MKDFFKELYVRITSESPEFFRKIRTWLIVIATICSTLVEQGINLTLYGYSVTQILAVATVIATIITFFAVKDGVNIQEKIEDMKNKKK